MRKITIGFQIGGKNIDSLQMMEELWTSQTLFLYEIEQMLPQPWLLTVNAMSNHFRMSPSSRMLNNACFISSSTSKQVALGNKFIVRSTPTHAQKRIKTSPEITVNSCKNAETLVFSNMVPEIAAVSPMKTETAESSIMHQKE